MSDKQAPDFQQLVVAIERTHHDLKTTAVQAVNTALTLRNWLVGRHIPHGLFLRFSLLRK
jgi:hypothetical protein